MNWELRCADTLFSVEENLTSGVPTPYPLFPWKEPRGILSISEVQERQSGVEDRVRGSPNTCPYPATKQDTLGTVQKGEPGTQTNVGVWRRARSRHMGREGSTLCR